MQTVVCRVHGEDAAQRALRQLQEGGFAPASVEVQSGLRAAWRSVTWPSFLWHSVVRLRRGDSLVIVRTADEHAPRAAAILEAAGAADVLTRPSSESHLY